MCPVCLATAAIIAGSATGTTGLSAFVVTKFFKRNPSTEFPEQTEAEEVNDDNKHDETDAS
jgi:hypothetical protein